MKLLLGLGPKLVFQAVRPSGSEATVEVFNDAHQIAYALMTPGIIELCLNTIKRVLALKPQVANVAFEFNLGDGAMERVIQTAAQGILGVATEPLRKTVSIGKRNEPGADLLARFDVLASPLTMRGIYLSFRNSRPAAEFRRRLRRKPKSGKKPPREI
jgi:hypothetical protein